MGIDRSVWFYICRPVQATAAVGHLRVSIKAQTVKTKRTVWAFLVFANQRKDSIAEMLIDLEKCLLRKGFALLRKPKDYRTYVRRRLWFACLWAFLALCQSAKKEFFDRLKKEDGFSVLFFYLVSVLPLSTASISLSPS